MKLEITEIFSEVAHYLSHAWVAVHPVFKWLLSGVMWVLFPTDAYVTYATVVGGMVVGDLVTKYIAISSNNGGFRNALKIGKLTSQSMWVGTRKKLVSYLVIMVFIGLAFRFEGLETPVKFISTVAYSVMFFREAQSILENLIEAGYKDLKWMLLFLKRKEKETLQIQEDAQQEAQKIQEIKKEEV